MSQLSEAGSLCTRLQVSKVSLDIFKNLDVQEADQVKEEVATEVTDAIERVEGMTDAGLEVQEEIAAHALPEMIAEGTVAIDVTKDKPSEKVVTVIAATTTDAIRKNVDEVVVAARVETTRVNLSLAQRMEIPKATAIRKAARLQLSVKTDRVHD
jgi:hypothetical protein